jgi:hypothetical protein
MKTTPNSLALSFVIRTVCLLAATSACQAQGDPDTANLVEVSPVPAQGTFFSMGRDFPPLPFDPFPDLPLFTVDAASGVYYYDDRGVNDSFAQGRAGVQIADDVPMPPGGSGGSGGGGSGSPISFITPTYTMTYDCHDWTNFWVVCLRNAGRHRRWRDLSRPGGLLPWRRLLFLQ